MLKTKINPKRIVEDRQRNLIKELEEEGVPVLAPTEIGGVLNIDSDYLILPKDLTDIPSRLLGNYLNSYTQNRMYMRTLIGWQEIKVENTKREYYNFFLPIYTELSKNKMSETSKELIANNDDSVKESFLVYKDEQQKLRLLQYSLSSIEDAIFLVSREISRRGSDFNTEQRNDSVQRR
ncbi:MAG: hypothetical protein R3Y64_11025 [Peptostreptococcaceae bacterium]